MSATALKSVIPAAVKASLVGAKRVKPFSEGPLLSNVSKIEASAALTAAINVVKLLLK